MIRIEKLFPIATTAVLVLLLSCTRQNNNEQWSIALHGGAGSMRPDQFTPEQVETYETELKHALQIGADILKNGGTSLDAVEQTVRYMEDCPLFNAGKGAVFNHDGKNELDAAIMDGSTLKAGSVAAITGVKNPISTARAVMEKSPHVMLSGAGALEFAKQNGQEIVDSSYYFTNKLWDALQKILQEEKKGTVGCVARDVRGNLAAATSTGGMINKRWGRIGDAPIIGAGTYANNQSCAVSATGYGEYFIRYTVAVDISALMLYKKLSLEEAAKLVIQQKLVAAGGEGGIIAVDKDGNICLEKNTSGMFRAFAKSNGEMSVAIFD